eukprot:2904728-Rhodomonas_salina.1
MSAASWDLSVSTLMLWMAATGGSVRLERMKRNAPTAITSAPTTPPAMPPIRATFIDEDEWSESSVEALPVSPVTLSVISSFGELRASGAMLFTPGFVANSAMLNWAVVPLSKTTIIWTVAVAELKPARSLRMLRRAPPHCSSRLSTESETTWTVSHKVAVSVSMSSRLRRSSLCSAAGSMHAWSGVSWSSTSKSATRSTGTSRALAIIEVGVTSNSIDAAFMPASLSASASGHGGGAPVLVERDEREEVDLLRDGEEALAGRLRRRPLVPRVDPVGAAEAAVELVLGVDGARKVGREGRGVVAVAQDPREEDRLRAAVIESRGHVADPGLRRVLGVRAAAIIQARRREDLHRRLLRPSALGVAALADVAAEDAALEGVAARGGARRVEGAHRQQLRSGLEGGGASEAVDGELERAVELVAVGVEAVGVRVVVADLRQQLLHRPLLGVVASHHAGARLAVLHEMQRDHVVQLANPSHTRSDPAQTRMSTHVMSHAYRAHAQKKAGG